MILRPRRWNTQARRRQLRPRTSPRLPQPRLQLPLPPGAMLGHCVPLQRLRMPSACAGCGGRSRGRLAR
eukprot:557567-Alexandrium_andersonii.AAC.1